MQITLKLVKPVTNKRGGVVPYSKVGVNSRNFCTTNHFLSIHVNTNKTILIYLFTQINCQTSRKTKTQTKYTFHATKQIVDGINGFKYIQIIYKKHQWYRGTAIYCADPYLLISIFVSTYSTRTCFQCWFTSPYFKNAEFNNIKNHSIK